MGMLEMPAQMPELFGLPEYKVTDFAFEIDGTDVRIACGVRRFGQVHWLYSVVIPAERLITCSMSSNEAARQALTINSMMDCRQQAH